MIYIINAFMTGHAHLIVFILVSELTLQAGIRFHVLILLSN
jgi:hypothetical protein